MGSFCHELVFSGFKWTFEALHLSGGVRTRGVVEASGFVVEGDSFDDTMPGPDVQGVYANVQAFSDFLWCQKSPLS